MPTYEVTDPSGKKFRVETPVGATEQDAINYLVSQQGQQPEQSQQTQQPQQPEQPKILKEGEGSDFFRGIGTYGDQMGGIYGGAKVLAGKAFGSDDLIKSGMESMQTSEAAIGRRGTKETDSFTRAIEKGVGSFVTEYIPFIAGQGVGMIGEALITSIAGGFLGSAVGPGGTVSGGVGGIVGKNLVKKGIKEEANKILKEQGQEASEAFIAKKVTEELAKPEMRKLVNKKIGQTTALGAMAGKFGAGEITGRAVDEAIAGVENPEEQLEIIKSLSTGKLATLSAAHALADFFAIKIGLGSLDKLNAATTNALVTVMKNIGITGVKEAPVEAVQTVLERYGADLPLDDKEALEEYINAAAAGFFMPIVPATIGGIRSTGEKKQEVLSTEEKEDESSNQTQREIQNAALAASTAQVQEEYIINLDPNNLVVDEALIENLGLKPTSNAAKDILNLDVKKKEDKEVLLNILDGLKDGRYKKVNPKAVEALIAKLGGTVVTEKIDGAEVVTEVGGTDEKFNKTKEAAKNQRAKTITTAKKRLDNKKITPEEFAEIKAEADNKFNIIIEGATENYKSRLKVANEKTAVLEAEKNVDDINAGETDVLVDDKNAEGDAEKNAFNQENRSNKTELTIEKNKAAAAYFDEQVKDQNKKGFENPEKAKIARLNNGKVEVIEGKIETRDFNGEPQLTITSIENAGTPQELTRVSPLKEGSFLYDPEDAQIERMEQNVAAAKKKVTKVAVTKEVDGAEKIGGAEGVTEEVVAEDNAQNEAMIKKLDEFYENQTNNSGDSNINKGFITRPQITKLVAPKKDEKPEEILKREQQVVAYFAAKNIEIETSSKDRNDRKRQKREVEIAEAKKKELSEAIPKAPSDVSAQGLLNSLFGGTSPEINYRAYLPSKNLFKKLVSFESSFTEPQQELIKLFREIEALNSVRIMRVDTLPENKKGQYDTASNTITFSKDSTAETILHELAHAATFNTLRKHITIKDMGRTTEGKRLVAIRDEAKKRAGDQFAAELDSMDEFVTAAFTNPEFQVFLASQKNLPEDSFRATVAGGIDSLWSKFVTAVRNILPGSRDIDKTLLSDVISEGTILFQGPDADAQAKMTKANKRILDQKKPDPETEVGKEISPPPLVEKKPGYLLKFANAVFSFDLALNDAIKQSMMALNIDQKTMDAVLTKISLSQVLHSDAVATQFIKWGNIQYDPETNKFAVFEFETDFNEETQKFVPRLDAEGKPIRAASVGRALEELDAIAKRDGIPLQELKNKASRGFVARRLDNLDAEQTLIKQNITNLIRQGKKEQAKLEAKKLKIVHMDAAERLEAKEIFNTPGIEDVYNTWIESRDKTVDLLVQQQVLSRKEGDEFKANIDYVPFYRQGEGKDGPKMWNKGLIQNDWHKFEGSYKPVNDVFENMEKWTRFSVRQSIINRAAIHKVDFTKEYAGWAIRDLRKEGSAFEEGSPIGSVVGVLRRTNPKDPNSAVQKVYYEFSDPVYATAITGIETAIIPGITFASQVANILRQNIVLYPLFSIAQLPQDSVSAMFSSGVKNPFMIPLRVLKQFPATLFNMSKTHEELKNTGVVGNFGSWNQSVLDAEDDINKPGLYNKIRREVQGNASLRATGNFLNKIAMASDNAVRQAVYEQTMSETGDKQLALERAFEVINFRRGGASNVITGGRQVIPFFGAALQALSVQGRVLAGNGVAPQEKAAAVRQFIFTLAQVQMVTLLYNMLMSDDEEFKELDPTIRDRRILFGNGTHLTLRPDIFTYLGKIMPEQILQQMVFESQDSAKIWESMRRNGLEIIGGGLPTPQFIRPALELGFNKSIRTGRAISPEYAENRVPSQQYNASTSEFAKLVGQTFDDLGLDNIPGLSSNPMKIDYFLKQYLGYTMGVGLMVVDQIIEGTDVFDYDRPSKSDRDALASIPGMRAFMTKEYGNRLTSDYYQLKQEVDKVMDRYNNLKKASWDSEKTREYYKENREMIRANEFIKVKTKRLSEIREERRRILTAPRRRYTADEKKVRLDTLNRFEKETLQGITEKRKIIYDTDILDF